MTDTRNSADLLRDMGTDAAKWTQEFIDAFEAQFFNGALQADLLDPTPGGWLHSWFANAIESGITEGYSRAQKEHNPDWPLSTGPDIRPTADRAAELRTEIKQLAQDNHLTVSRVLREILQQDLPPAYRVLDQGVLG